MKKILTIISICFLLLMVKLPACYGDEKSDAKKTSEDYYEALKNEYYDTAFGLLSSAARKYYGNVNNYTSTFKVPGLKIKEYKIYKTDMSKTGAVVKTLITYTISGVIADKPIENTTSYKDEMVKENGKWKIKAKFGPYKSIAVRKHSQNKNLKVVVYAIDFYPDFVSVNMAFNNLGKDKIIVLPYNKKTALTFDKKSLPTVELPYMVDNNLYAGVTLNGGKSIVGFVNFLGGVPDKIKKISLKIDGNLNTKDPKPFEIQINNIEIK